MPRTSVLVDDFVSHIADDGTKYFAYKVRLPQYIIEQEREQRAKMLQQAPQRRGGVQIVPGISRERMLILANKSLEEFFLDNGYCRYGYFELDKFVRASSAEIRGECNETATSIDKKRFPNKQEVPSYSGS